MLVKIITRQPLPTPRLEHEVKLVDFTSWLERPGRSPREVTQRQRIRAILGTPVSR
jgi:hypothetical protein